jgi:hypothetical protein
VTFGKYALVVLITVALTQAAALPALTDGARSAVALGAALAAANALLAFALTEWGLRKSARAFLAATLGGMAARMALVLSAMVVAVSDLGLPVRPLALSLLAYFVPFLILELTILHKATLPSAAAR